jgi:itaconyl-CoA hydratase
VSSNAPTPPRAATWLVHGHTLSDFTVGRVFEHGRRRTLLESDNALFTTLTLHYNPLYLDREYARAAGFDDILMNPLLVFNTVFGMSVEDLSEGGGPFLGVEALEYGAAVHAGDTLQASSTVLTARLSAKHEHYGIVSWATRGCNQRGEQVISFNRANLVRRSR